MGWFGLTADRNLGSGSGFAKALKQRKRSLSGGAGGGVALQILQHCILCLTPML